MILRRLATALKHQDWVPVIIEFALVVAGVLIALQVDTWNDKREDRALERQYLERLFTDFNGSIEDFITNLDWDLSRLERQYLALESLRAGALDADDEEAFASALAWAGIHNPQRRRWGTVEELISTGNIGLIRDLTLRAEIASLDAGYDRSAEIVRDAMDRAGRLRSQLTRRYDIRAFEGNAPGNALVIYDFHALAQDSEFINTLADLQLSSSGIVGFSHSSMARFETLRNRLAEKLGIDSAGLPTLPERTPGPWEIAPEGDLVE